MKKKNIVIERLLAKTPCFWKKVQKIALSFGGSGAAVMVANSSFALTIDTSIIKFVSYVVVVCAAIAGTAQLTKEDKA